MKGTPLELDFPFLEVNRIATREANARSNYRPVYTSHKYWARRPGAVFRALLLYLFHPNPPTDSQAFWNLYRREVDLGGKVILDPFMGGGVVPFEAVRLGCKVIAKDLNPLSWWVVKNELEPVNFNTIEAEFQQIKRDLAPKILKLYETRCSKHPDTPVHALHYFWVKGIKCDRCGRINYLFNNYLLAPVSRKSPDWYIICPECFHVFVSSKKDGPCSCPVCEESFSPLEKGPKRGSEFRCRHCEKQGIEHEQNIIERVGDRGEKLDHHLYAVELICPRCGSRVIQSPDPEERAMSEGIIQKLEEFKTTRGKPAPFLPFQERRPSFSDRVLNHGYLTFQEMFNPRQQFVLHTLLERIANISEPRTRDFFLFVFSDMLAFNNEFCEYNRSNRTLCWIWNKRTIISRPVYVENNLWGLERGTGSFLKEYRKILRAKRYLVEPYEKYFEGDHIKKSTPQAPIEVNFADQFDDLANSSNVYLLFGDSRDLDEVPDGSVDAIVTDPPYFDYVMYADMADFYYAWLHLVLKDQYPAFASPLIPKSKEIVKDPVTGKSKTTFVEGLTQVFSSARHKLKPGGVLVFTYHHLDPSAWVAIGQILAGAQFVITKTYPLVGEMKTNLHIQKKRRAAQVDIVFICRDSSERTKWRESFEGDIKALHPAILEAFEQCRAQFVQNAIHVPDTLSASLLMAKSLEILSLNRQLIEEPEFIDLIDALETKIDSGKN